LSALLWACVLIVSLGVLLKAAGAFIRSAELIGLHFGLSPFVLGITVVAFGTSFPELVSGVTSVIRGVPEVAVGTAVGSNVTNILLILGIAAALGNGLVVNHEIVRVDLPFLFGSALMLWFFGFDGHVSTLEAILALAALAAYLLYAASSPGDPETAVGVSAAVVRPVLAEGRPALETGNWIALLGSAVFTQLGAYYTVESAVELAGLLSVGAEVVATTVVAFGTSLPELVVSARAAREGKPEVAVGNVIGSNVFNSLGVVGVSALFGTVTVPESIAGFTLPAMVGATVLAFFVLQEREVTRWDAWLLVVLYLAFMVQVVGAG